MSDQKTTIKISLKITYIAKCVLFCWLGLLVTSNWKNHNWSNDISKPHLSQIWLNKSVVFMLYILSKKIKIVSYLRMQFSVVTNVWKVCCCVSKMYFTAFSLSTSGSCWEDPDSSAQRADATIHTEGTRNVLFYSKFNVTCFCQSEFIDQSETVILANLKELL